MIGIQKSKIKNQNFKPKLLNFLIVLLTFTFYLLPSVYAVDSTPSSSTKEKLQELQKQIASKAAKLKQEVNNKLKDKAYVGAVKTKSATSLTLASSKGPKIVSTNQDTIFESQVKLRKKFSQSTILEEDYLAALGDIDETGVLLARKIVLLPTPSSKLKTPLWGQVMVISNNLISLKTKDKKNISVSLPKLAEVKLNEYLISVGILNEKEIFEAEFVHIIPQSGSVNIKKLATPSATAKPNPSATSSAKPKSSTR